MVRDGGVILPARCPLVFLRSTSVPWEISSHSCKRFLLECCGEDELKVSRTDCDKGSTVICGIHPPLLAAWNFPGEKVQMKEGLWPPSWVVQNAAPGTPWLSPPFRGNIHTPWMTKCTCVDYAARCSRTFSLLWIQQIVSATLRTGEVGFGIRLGFSACFVTFCCIMVVPL